jgi:hypothetical protein
MEPALHRDHRHPVEVAEEKPARMGFEGGAGEMGDLLVLDRLLDFDGFSDASEPRPEDQPDLRLQTTPGPHHTDRLPE